MTATTLSIRPSVLRRIAGVMSIALAGGLAALAQDPYFTAGNLVVSRSVYDNNPGNVALGAILPPGCANTQGACASEPAQWNGSYPTVWNNNLNDGSFGVTSKILLDQITPAGVLVNTLEVPNSSDAGITSSSNQMVTSFSSKSELALNLSTNGNYLTFMGYLSPIDALDVSNSNTAFLSPWTSLSTIDLTNPVGEYVYRVVGQVDQNGNFHFTKSNSYSGNNGRAALLNESADVVYMAGNAGNGSSPQPNGIIAGTGAQILTPSTLAEIAQFPGAPTPVGSFNITQVGDKADKIGKDTNFRGLTVFNNVIYYTKGSGSNGINTVYFLDTTGTACPSGVGLPSSSAVLPTTPIAYSIANLQTEGITPYNMCILQGFNTSLAKSDTTHFPFGLFFANANTLYVADEGNGTDTYSTASGTYTAAAAQTTAGLQKWIFNSSTGSWQLAYTLSAGLNLGVPYTVSGYPTGNNSATNLPWAPATDGLRNITGQVNGNNVTIWAITSTVSGNGDQGADPNQLVVITDSLSNTTAAGAASESFSLVRSAGYGEVLRGVSFTPASTLPPSL